MNRLQGTVDGYVIKVNYTKLTCEVVYREKGSHTVRTMNNVALPKDADGMFSQSVRNGDTVMIAFKNQSKESPYVSTVYKGDHAKSKYTSPYGRRTMRESRIL